MTGLLRFFSYHQPRRIRVIENTLRNRRTVTNLFWARQYGILEWLGAYRTLSRNQYNQQIQQLINDKLLLIDEKDIATLTEKGAAILAKNKQYEPSFYEWYWLVNTHQVMQRLLLAMQVVSEYSYHQNKYVPLVVPYREMMAVKYWFRQNYHRDMITELYSELHRFGGALASENTLLADDFFNALVGHDSPGKTMMQASEEYGFDFDDVQFLRHDELLAISAYARQFPGLLQQLLQPIINKDPLSKSAAITFNMYQRGKNIQNIARERHLKENTIREHLLETAILVPNKVDWESLLPAEIRKQLGEVYHGQPETWHFNEEANNSFYEYRLYQLYQGVGKGEER